MKEVDLTKFVPPVEPKLLNDTHKRFYNHNFDSTQAIKLKQRTELMKGAKSVRGPKSRGFLTSRSSIRPVDDYIPFSEPYPDEKQTVKQKIEQRFASKLMHKKK